MIWNQHQAAPTGSREINNVSGRWRKRYRLVVGKHHPDPYSALGGFRKEQADGETMIADLSSGRKVRAVPR